MNDPVINQRINYLTGCEEKIDISKQATSRGCWNDAIYSKNSERANRGDTHVGSNIYLSRELGIFENGISKWSHQTLLHELSHAYDNSMGYNKGRIGKSSATDPAEIRAAQLENRLRRLCWPYVLRTTYGNEMINFTKFGGPIANN